MVGYDDILNPARLRVALFLGDLGLVERLIDETPSAFREGIGWFSLLGTPARLDALVALGDHDRVESKAVMFLNGGTCLEPYAMRAIGVVREDGALIERAAEQFEDLELSTAARETRALFVRPSLSRRAMRTDDLVQLSTRKALRRNRTPEVAGSSRPAPPRKGPLSSRTR